MEVWSFYCANTCCAAAASVESEIQEECTWYQVRINLNVDFFFFLRAALGGQFGNVEIKKFSKTHTNNGHGFISRGRKHIYNSRTEPRHSRGDSAY